MEKCKYCSEESISKKLCIKECNNEKGYYFINSILSNYNVNNDNFIDCANSKTKPSNFYFNIEKKEYQPCFYMCATCNYGGNLDENNCTLCEKGLIFEPDYINSKNCVKKCLYYYYYLDGQYKCTNSPQCPEEYSLLIRNKNKCTDNCESDILYKYQYNGECYEECPNNTSHDENDYLCKDINLNKCLLSENEFKSLNENIADKDIEQFSKNYVKEFWYTDNHISVFKNDIYSITFYKNAECISDLKLEIPQIDFGECYQKVRENYHINTSESLVIAIIAKKEDGVIYPKMVSYSMIDPNFGNKLESDDLCKNETLMVQENLLAKLDKSKVNLDFILYLAGQNIDIFNLSSVFYTDICFHFDSPIDKDIALKDRILLCFPNVTLCENNCQIKGVNLTSLKAMCECPFNNKLSNFIGSNLLSQSQLGDIENILGQTNIEIIKCYEDIFKYKYFISSSGNFIIIFLILSQVICTIVYYKKNLFLVSKYIIDIADKFISYIYASKLNFESQNNRNIKSKTLKYTEPPKKKTNLINSVKKQFEENIDRKSKKGKTHKKKSKFKLKGNSINSFENSPKNEFLNSKNNSSGNNNKYTFVDSKLTTKNLKLYSNKLSFDDNQNEANNNFSKSIKIANDIDLKEYLVTDFDDMDYDDAIRKDNRKFCEFFWDKLKSNQIILNTFFITEPLKPRAIKILLFILNVDLYLFVNALFFNEEYVSQIFNSKEKETFFSFVPRSLDRFLYTTIVGVILNYITDFFFVEEKKIKGILKREKDSAIILRYEMTQLVKTIKNRYFYFILISFIITILTWYYIFCFNNIYPHMKIEWIKSSFVIIIIMQILSILLSLLERIIRLLSFKCKSEKLYKISLFLS